MSPSGAYQAPEIFWERQLAFSIWLLDVLHFLTPESLLLFADHWPPPTDHWFYGSIPALISSACFSATWGYVIRCPRLFSAPGSSERVAHRPIATAAAQVIDTKNNDRKSAPRLPLSGTERATP